MTTVIIMQSKPPKKNTRLEICKRGIKDLPIHRVYDADIILQSVRHGYCKVLKDKTGKLL